MKKLLLFLLLTLACIQNTECAVPIGAEVTYRHLKNMEYEVTIVAYRDCRGLPFSNYGLIIYNDSFSTTAATTRVKIEDILFYCKNKPCSPSNSTVTTAGVEAHYFTATIDFNSGIFKKFISKNYCNVYFAFDFCCRNGGITTIGTGNMFVESMLNLCLAIKSPVNSPQFVNPIQTSAYCNQTFSYSFYSNNYFNGDSVSYKLVKAKNGKNSTESYNSPFRADLPLTPFCLPPGSVNCPFTSVNPVKGTFFDSTNGKFLITPIKCTEVGVIVGQVNIYRKDNGTYQLVGYSKRDMQVVVSQAANNKPTLSTYKDYTIKARENTCIDILIKDDTTKTNKDTVKLVVRAFPKYGKLTLVDSNAREKTMRFCWNPSDSDYLKNHEAAIAIYAYDMPCFLGQNMSTSIHFKVLPPDSFTNIKIRTFYDRNGNGQKDAGEPYRSAPVLSEKYNTFTLYQTDSVGQLNLKQIYTNFKFNINRSQFIYSTSKDTLLLAKFDSTHVINLGFNYYQGIKGKVYEDVNNNCVFDAVDIALKGIKVVSDKNALALSDYNGDYLFNNTVGKYRLSLDNTSLYESTCSPFRDITIVKDSQFYNYDFPLRKKSGFKDLSIVLNTQNHNRNGVKMTQTFVVENKGTATAKNFYVKLVPSRKLYQFSSTSTTSTLKDTIFWLIDSLTKGSSITKDFSHTLMADSFMNGDQITYQLWVSYTDDVTANNYYELTETVSDVACCKTEKVTYAKNRYYPTNNTIIYRVFFKPIVASKGVIAFDNIDTSRLDIRTLRILANNSNQVLYIKGNTLTIDVTPAVFLNNVECVYAVDLKKPFTDSFTVYNSATCNFDYNAPIISNTVANTIITPIEYDILSKTAYCNNEFVSLPFKTNYKPSPDNHFKVYVSDTFGKFSQLGLLLDTAVTDVQNTLKVRLPFVAKSHIYSMKVTGTNPALEAMAYVNLPQIIINPVPAINYTTNLNNSNICKLDTIILKGRGTYEYRFIKNSSPTGAFSRDSIYTETMKANANYEISFRSKEGCVNTSPIITTTLFPVPVVVLTANKNIFCDGELLNLQFSGANTYKLFRNANTIIGTGITSSPYQLTPPLNTSQYTMVGTDINGCRDTSTIINVLVNPLPAKPVIVRVGKGLQSSYTFNNQWYSIGGKIDSAKNQFFYPQADGKYFVRHKDTNGCENTSDLFDVNYTSVSSILNPATFRIYPNPTTNVLTIENKNEYRYSFNIYDTYGRVILSGASEEAGKVLNLELLSAGNYLLRINAEGQVQNFRIVLLK